MHNIAAYWPSAGRIIFPAACWAREPLFFQVVIDKVLTHRGFTTLDVLVMGLITVSMFQTVLGALRTYGLRHILRTDRFGGCRGCSVFGPPIGILRVGVRRLPCPVGNCKISDNYNEFPHLRS